MVLAALALTAQVAAVRDPGFRVHAPTNAEHNHEKVQVYYYMESLCPDCAKFGAGALSDAVGELAVLALVSPTPTLQLPSTTTPVSQTSST